MPDEQSRCSFRPYTHSAPQSLSNQLFRRSTFHRRLYRCNDRPSCVLGAVRLLRCGAIISMPRLASAASKVIRLVANQTFGFIRHKTGVNRGLNKFGFVRRSTRYVNGDRKARNCHDLAPFTALTMAAPPFWLAQMCRRYCQVDLATCIQILGQNVQNLDEHLPRLGSIGDRLSWMDIDSGCQPKLHQCA
jgi:hypothetical protein